MDIDRSHGNVQLQVAASCCHWAHLSQGARLAGRQEEEGVRGVTPPMDDDHTGAPAKTAAGPVLLLWSFGIPLSRRQFQGNNIVALIVLQIAA